MTICVAKGDGLVKITVDALNALTHANAFEVADGAGSATHAVLTPKTPPPSAYAHNACFGLAYRMMINPSVCTIETSPGLNLGTVAVDDPNAQDELGGATTQAADSKGAGNPAHFGSSQSWGEYLTFKEDKSGKGSGAKIVWNPYAASTLNWVGGKSKREHVPACIVLAHELSHADRMMRGTSLVGVVGKVAPPAYSAKVPGTDYESMVDIEHIEMVGFTSASWQCKDADVISENQMRREHGIPLRVNY
ncbi:M91 family zinc metallopeptidase [Denitrobaculum tricleocarpae]|nr:M91 family zinc metallopeptidase [Denitrobaculum tricleocarpae]